MWACTGCNPCRRVGGRDARALGRWRSSSERRSYWDSLGARRGRMAAARSVCTERGTAESRPGRAQRGHEPRGSSNGQHSNAVQSLAGRGAAHAGLLDLRHTRTGSLRSASAASRRVYADCACAAQEVFVYELPRRSCSHAEPACDSALRWARGPSPLQRGERAQRSVSRISNSRSCIMLRAARLRFYRPRARGLSSCGLLPSLRSSTRKRAACSR